MKKLTKKDIYARVGHINQIAGYKKYILEDGKKQGMRAVDIWNGSGLALTILCDRASDIYSMTLSGKSICWMSNIGITSPLYKNDEDFGWNKNFSGGMFASCGLHTAGVPVADECGEELRLHGDISNTPSDEVNITSFWEGDDYIIKYVGKTYQSSPFGYNYCMTRTIKVKMFDNTVYIHDNIENLSFETVPFMLIYHMNFGYPLLDESSKLYLTYKERFPTSPAAFDAEDKLGEIYPPSNDFVPVAYNHTIKAQEDGFGYTSIINEDIALGATLKFNVSALDKFNIWKSFKNSSYLVALEPSNCRTWGRDKEREAEQLRFLKPFESEDAYLELKVYSDKETIETEKRRYGSSL